MDALFPPGPQKSLLFGDAPQFKSNPFEYLLQSARTYGDLVHFRFGPSHAYLLTNPRDAHFVLVERYAEFTEKPSLLRALNSAMGHDLFAPDDPLSRQPIRRGTFKARWLEPFIDDAARLSAQALDGWQGGDPMPMLEALTLAVVTRTLFGDPDTRLIERLARALADQRDDQHFQSPLTPPLWMPTARNRQRQRAAAELKQIVRVLLEDHRRQGRYGVLSCLLQVADSAAWAVEEMLALFDAGHEAAAQTLAWAWSLLTEHPDAADALKAEMDAVLGGRPPTADDLPKLVYCEMILKETLRLHPPVWLISRQAKRETRLGEYYVPAGSTIFVSPYVIHHSRRYYTAPEHFLPERFAQRGSAYSYLPFGAGMYAEVEHDYALSVAKLILAQGAQRFQLERIAPASDALTAQPLGLALRPQRFAVAAV